MTDWTPLSPEEAATFIEAVKDKTENVLFAPVLCEVHKRPIDFYEGYDLVRIVNKHMVPYLLLDYLSNGEDHYYMDGGESAFHNLNARMALSLNEENVISYLDLFISYVYEHGNSLGFLHKENNQNPAKLLGFDGQTYNIETPLIYQENIVQARVAIQPGGAINVQDPLQAAFLQDLHPGDDMSYRHPREKKIIEESKMLLEQTETGRALLQTEGADIRVLSSPNYQSYVTNEGVVYIVMPAAEQTSKHLQALLLVAGLRDLQQVRAGATRPDPAEDKTIYTVVNFGKNLDTAVEQCKMVEEMEALNMPAALAALTKLGLGKLYEGYKNKMEAGQLKQVYIASLEENGLIRKE